MAAPRPTGYPTWCATGATNLAQPDGTHQGVGWAVNEAPPSSYFNYLQQQYFNWLAYLDAQRSPGWFGDGSDGVATLAGATSIARDMLFQSLTITPSGILNTANYKVFARDTITNNGWISGDGPSATGISGAAAVAAGSLLGGGSGGAGGTGVTGIAGTAVLDSLGGGGGTGGLSSLNGLPGVATALPSTFGSPRSSAAALSGYAAGNTGGLGFIRDIRGGGGGGGGNNNLISTGYGGGGGAGAGVVLLGARTITNSGRISAVGGSGGAATGLSTGSGGGGGGGVIYISTTLGGYVGATGPTSLSVAGGLAGSTGAAGTGMAGQTGTIVFNVPA